MAPIVIIYMEKKLFQNPKLSYPIFFRLFDFPLQARQEHCANYSNNSPGSYFSDILFRVILVKAPLGQILHDKSNPGSSRRKSDQ